MRLLLSVIVLLAAATVMLADPVARRGRAERAREFQHLVGGLGFGPAAELSRCAFSFDPRLCPSCPLQDGPIPAGAVFCPAHGCAILYYPPLETVKHAPAP